MGPESSAPAAPAAPATPVALGDVVAGKYRVDRVLGAGGMGVVVAATQFDLDRRVAIKFLLPSAMKNPEVVARFSREARAAAKIQSEHVARVIDVGTLPDGAPFMVMEYLEGSDLAARIESSGRLPLADVARYVLEACEALAEAHAAGIVHRDLKPANLFLAHRPDRTTRVKVLDFGISKAAVGDGGITSTQAVMGSPLYMSPEQLVSTKSVDARADVWSLGVVLFEALTGGPPFTADSMPEIVAKILALPAPSVLAARPDLPPEIDTVVARCLAKEPSARFKDVAELARALAPFSPDGARSVERVSRVLGDPSLDENVAAQPQPPPSSLPGPPATARSDTSWGATHPAGVPRGRSTALWTIGTAGIVVVAAATAFLLLRPSRATVQDATGASLSAPAQAIPAAAPLPPVPATATAAATLVPELVTTPSLAPAGNGGANIPSGRIPANGMGGTRPRRVVTGNAPSALATSPPVPPAAPVPTNPLNMTLK